MKPRCERVRDVQRVVQVEHLQPAEREEAEAERGERGDRRADRRDLLQPGERGLHRRLHRVLVLDDLAEDVVLLVLAARRLVHEERDQRHDRAGDAEDEERPAPALSAAGPRRRSRRRGPG